MKRFINKALFYKEWINVRWVTVLTVLILLYFKLFGVISQLNTNKMFMKEQGRLWSNRWFNNGLFSQSEYYVVMVCVVIILSIILFIGEKTSETQGFTVSMPFTRKEIILNKWLVGVVSIIISFAVAFIALSLFYASNLYYMDTALNPFSDIIKWFFMDTFQYTCIFTVMMFVQTVMGNSIVSGVVGSIVLIVPYFILTIIKEIVVQITRCKWESPIMLTFNKVENWLNIYSYNLPEQQWYDVKANMDTNMYRTFYYHNYELKLSILFALTCLFLYLAYVCYKKRNLEYNLRLLAFKNMEKVFIWGFSICSGFLVGAILGFGNNQNLNAFWLWGLVGVIAGYFVSKVLVK